MLGNAAVQNPAAANLHDQQHVQDLEASRDRDQKVAGDDRLRVIVNKGPTMLRRCSRVPIEPEALAMSADQRLCCHHGK